MTPQIHTTFRLLRSLGVLLTLMVTLPISSSQVVIEECSQEAVSQQIELVMVRRHDDTEISTDDRFRPDRCLTAGSSSRNRFFAAITERASLNGSGTHLLI